MENKRGEQKRRMASLVGGTMVLFLVFSLSFALADSGVGVATPYWKDYPLKMYPGETATINLNLQVISDSDESVSFVAEIVNDGNGIAFLAEPGNVYTVGVGEKRDIPIKISVPSTASIGDQREVIVSFVQAESEDSGMVVLGVGAEGKFPVQIVTREESTFYNSQPAVQEIGGTSYWLWIVLALVVILIAYFVLRPRK